MLRPKFLPLAPNRDALYLPRMITKRPWFGPKRWLGWGLAPVSWEGWAVSAAFVLAMVGIPLVLGRRTTETTVAMIACVIAFIATAILTGTRPGGPGLWPKR